MREQGGNILNLIPPNRVLVGVFEYDEGGGKKFQAAYPLIGWAVQFHESPPDREQPDEQTGLKIVVPIFWDTNENETGTVEELATSNGTFLGLRQKGPDDVLEINPAGE